MGNVGLVEWIHGRQETKKDRVASTHAVMEREGPEAPRNLVSLTQGDAISVAENIGAGAAPVF